MLLVAFHTRYLLDLVDVDYLLQQDFVKDLFVKMLILYGIL